MVTAAQVLANQTDAQISTGPATAEGKAASAQNALRHSFRSQGLVLTAAEQVPYRRPTPWSRPAAAVRASAQAPGRELFGASEAVGHERPPTGPGRRTRSGSDLHKRTQTGPHLRPVHAQERPQRAVPLRQRPQVQALLPQIV
jgi:hypothetical protein